MGTEDQPNGFSPRRYPATGPQKWYAGSKHYADNLASDIKLREHLKKKLAHAAAQQDRD